MLCFLVFVVAAFLNPIKETYTIPNISTFISLYVCWADICIVQQPHLFITINSYSCNFRSRKKMSDNDGDGDNNTHLYTNQIQFHFQKYHHARTRTHTHTSCACRSPPVVGFALIHIIICFIQIFIFQFLNGSPFRLYINE